MSKFAMLLAVIGALWSVTLVAPAGAASARTFVSASTGTNNAACSRTNPCQTFAQALLATSAGGEINCIDAGDYGTANITIAVTISCEAGTAGVIAPSGPVAMYINAGTSDAITLRGLDIDGLGSGDTGVDIASAGTVHIENCAIRGFRSAGSSTAILTSIANTNTTFIFVTDSVLSGNGNGLNLQSGGGYKIASLKNVTITGSTNDGVHAQNAAVFVNITESIISGNGGSAIDVLAGGSEVNVDRTTMANNVVALNAAVSGATIRSIGNNIFDNTTAFSIASGATISTDGQNRTGGNVNGQNGNASLTLK